MQRLPIILLLLVPVLAGCASDPYQAMYESIKRRNETFKIPNERATPPDIPSYKEYQMERERLAGDGE